MARVVPTRFQRGDTDLGHHTWEPSDAWIMGEALVAALTLGLAAALGITGPPLTPASAFSAARSRRQLSSWEPHASHPKIAKLAPRSPRLRVHRTAV